MNNFTQTHLPITCWGIFEISHCRQCINKLIEKGIKNLIQIFISAEEIIENKSSCQ